jgi:TonB family C-terminal domain
MRSIALLESERHRDGRGGGSGIATSLVLHGGILALAIAATAGSRISNEREAVFVPLYQWHRDPAPARPQKAAPQAATHATIPVLATPSLRVSVPSVIPGVIPDLPLSALPSAPAIPSTGSQVGTPAASGGDQPFGIEEVDEPAAALDARIGPRYPEALQRMGIEGRVVARFVVGTDGRVEGRPAILSATSDQFTESVLRYLTGARYRAARRNGIAVRQLVEQEFDFEVSR